MLRKILPVLLLAAVLPAAAETVKHILPNGLTVVIREDRRAPVAAMQLWYKIGSADETKGQTGLSHALEHMMFKGTKTVPAGEYMSRIAALGGQPNAYTTATETVYHVNIAAKHLPEILRLEADRMANLHFSDTVFANEMKVIREERRQNLDDNPSGKLYELLLQQAYRRPANRTPVIGEMADLRRLKADDLRRWYRRWYVPNNAVLVIVGDVDAKTALDAVRRTFGSIPQRPLPARQSIDEPATGRNSSARAVGNTKQPMLVMAYRVPNLHTLGDRLPHALNALSNILDGHSAARFNKNLIRGKQLAMEAGVGYSLISRQPQLWRITAMPTAHTSSDRLKKALAAEIDEIAAHGVSEAELKRMQSIEEAEEIYAKDSIAAQARLIGMLETNGFSHADEAELRRRFKAVSAADVQQAAQLLQRSRLINVELLPQNGRAQTGRQQTTR